ncbi:MAG: MATE family efflux transporter [Polyangiales bacterium]
MTESTTPGSGPLRAEARENLRLAGPIVLTQIGTMLMGLVDTAIVGRLGERELAGVSIGNVLSFAAAVPVIGLLTAIEPLAAQAIGAGDRRTARSALREGVRLALLLSVPFALVTLGSLWLLPLVHVDPAIIPSARVYVLARLPSLLPLFLYIAAKTYQQAVLRPRAAVEAVVIANVINAAVGWALTFGDTGLVRAGLPALGVPALGVAGVGIATSVATAVEVVWLFGVRRRVPLDARDAALPGEAELRGVDRATLAKLVRVGTPLGLQFLAEVGVFTVVTLLMGRIGGRATAAHQIALGLASFSFMGALGVSQATSVRVAHAVGAQTHRGTRRAGVVGIVLGVSMMGASSLAFALAPTLLARLFTPQPEVIAAAVPLIRIAALFQLFDGAQVVSAGALRGTGDTRWPLVANVLIHWFVGLPLGCVLAFSLHRGATGLWYGLTAGLVFIGTGLTWRFFRVTRLTVARL